MRLVPFNTRLDDGEEIHVREVTPEDRRLLEIGFEDLSPRSRRLRFMGAHPRLTPQELSRFTAENDLDHVAVGALSLNDARPLGIARYIRAERCGDEAEFAVTIIDDHQGLGLGSLLLGVLAKHAVRNEISHFRALVDAKNLKMLALLGDLGSAELSSNGYESEFSVPLYADATDYPDTPAGRRFRTAYASTMIE